MPQKTVVASANILYKLARDDARTALSQVLEADPDLVALQEWYVIRLAPAARVRGRPDRSRIQRRRRDSPYHWVSAVAGGNVVAPCGSLRADLLAGVFLSGVGRSDRTDRFLRLEPPRVVTVGVFQDLSSTARSRCISYHLVPGVQADGAYRADRPRLVRRHRSEVGGWSG